MASDGTESDFSGSFTDMMTSLAIVFLILAVGMIITNVLSQDENAHLGALYNKEFKSIESRKLKLLDDIKEQFNIQKKGSLVSTSDNCVEIDASEPFKVVLRFNGHDEQCKKQGLFFEPDKFHFDTTDVAVNISRLAKIYKNLCVDQQLPNSLANIQIVGHTDSDTSYRDEDRCIESLQKRTVSSSELKEHVRALQCGNIGLSSQRARTVFLLISRHLLESGDLRTLSCLQNTTQASGRGPFSPKGNAKDKISKENGPSLKAQNRRVEIEFQFNQPSPKT